MAELRLVTVDSRSRSTEREDSGVPRQVRREVSFEAKLDDEAGTAELRQRALEISKLELADEDAHKVEEWHSSHDRHAWETLAERAQLHDGELHRQSSSGLAPTVSIAELADVVAADHIEAARQIQARRQLPFDPDRPKLSQVEQEADIWRNEPVR